MSPLVITIVVTLIGVVLAAVCWFGWDELLEVRVALWTAWCFLFTIGWRIRFKLRSVFAQSALAVLFVASSYLVIEFAVALLHKSGFVVGDPHAGYHLALVANVPEIPLPYEIASLILAALMARHHFKEWKISRRQSEVPRAVEGLLLEFDKYLSDGTEKNQARKAAFLEVVMGMVKALMDARSKRDVAISLMEKEAKADALLAVTFIHPPKVPLDKEFKVAVGKGCAGKAYDKKVPIYIPSIRHLVGINGVTLKSTGVTYEPSGDKKNFRSLLSVPVVAKSNVIAVLTFSSRRPSAFDPEDFEIARLGAAFVAMFY